MVASVITGAVKVLPVNVWAPLTRTTSTPFANTFPLVPLVTRSNDTSVGVPETLNLAVAAAFVHILIVGRVPFGTKIMGMDASVPSE